MLFALYGSLLPMGLSGLEPPTSRLSGVRSNRLSYKPRLDKQLRAFLLHCLHFFHMLNPCGLFLFSSGSRLLSHTVSSTVSSAAGGLTIVFGMGTGVSPWRIATGIFSLFFSDALSFPLWNSLHQTSTDKQQSSPYFFPRKEVIQPHLPIRLPCYDFTPVTRPAFGGSLPFRLGHRLRAFPTPMV